MWFAGWQKLRRWLFGSPGSNPLRPTRTSHLRQRVEVLESRVTPSYSVGLGSTSDDFGFAIAVDGTGNIYVAGSYSNTVDFDPGPGIVNLTGGLNQDIFLAKYDAAGALVWARGMGGAAFDQGRGLVLDGAGNIYLTGFYSGTVDFDPGAGTFNLPNAGQRDVFLAKFDNGGNFLWADGIGSTGNDVGYDLALDSTGNPLLIGYFSATADFDPGPGTVNLTSVGMQDIFLAKFDGAGGLLWANAMGGPNNENWNDGSLVLDAADNIYITGDFAGTVDFDPGPGVVNLSSFGSPTVLDVYVAKLDPAGNLVWARQMGGGATDSGMGIALDAAGNVYTTGMTSGGDFDPGPGNFNLNPACCTSDLYISKLDNSGNFVWALNMGTSGQDMGYDIAIGPADHVFTTGYFTGPVDFDPGAGTFTLAGAGQQDVYISELTSAGAFVGAWSMGGPTNENDFGGSLAVDAAGTAYVTGNFTGTADLDPGPGVASVTSMGSRDILMAAFNTVAGVSVAQGGGSTDVSEGGPTDTYTIVLNSAPTADVTITLNVGTQVTVSQATLTFTSTDWNMPQTITVTAIDDTPAEGTHSGIIAHSASSSDPLYNGIAILSVTANITDNETAGVTITPSGGSTILAEGGATDSYAVVLTSQPSADVTVSLTPNAQVSAAPTSLVFTTANWNLAQSVTVTAVDDVVVEGGHSGLIAHVAVSTDLVYSGIAIAGVTATITDNDFPQGVIVTQTAGSTDVAESGATDIYTIVLNSSPTANVIITLNAGSQLQLSAPSLTFTTANWNTPQTVVVAAVDDAIAQGTGTAAITHVATSADPLYNGIAIAAVTANVTDNDAFGITFAPTTIDLAEGGSNNTYTVVLNSQPTANVVVAVNPDGQQTTSSATVIFTPANWNVRQTITAMAVDDAVAEALHTGLIAHSTASADGNYSGLSRTVTARISDNENPGVIISLTNGPLSILEGTSKTYTAVLNSPPAADVVVTINPDGQLSASPASITFTPADWNTPRPVVVTANEDGAEEGDHFGRITHTAISADAAFNNLPVVPVTAAIVDNDGSSINGTDRADQITVTFAPDRILVAINGRTTTLPGTLTQLTLLAQGGNDNIQVVAPTIPLVILGGPGVDKVFVTGQTAANTFTLGDSSVEVNGRSVGVWEVEGLTVNGKGGNDSFTVQQVPSFAVEFKGDLGNDIVVGPARPNTWQIATANGGTLDSSIKLTAVENWIGGSSTDRFAFAAGKSLSGRIDGGGGANSLDYGAATTPVTVNLQTFTATGVKSFANISGIVGGKGAADRLIGADASNLWNITGQNAGSVNGMSFQALENLTGGSSDDTFLFADGQGLKGKIDGGGGSDALDYTGYLSKPVAVNLQTRIATGLAGFANVEQVQGGSGLADVLIGANKISTWNLTGPGAGGVAGLVFGNFENLTGGTLADTFVLDAAGDWLGTLNGGSGTDILTAFSGRTNQWVNIGLGAGTLNGRKFLAIESRR